MVVIDRKIDGCTRATRMPLMLYDVEVLQLSEMWVPFEELNDKRDVYTLGR